MALWANVLLQISQSLCQSPDRNETSQKGLFQWNMEFILQVNTKIWYFHKWHFFESTQVCGHLIVHSMKNKVYAKVSSFTVIENHEWIWNSAGYDQTAQMVGTFCSQILVNTVATSRLKV